MSEHFDRHAEDLSNIIALEHINVQVPDQRLATIFYVTGLGLTRDPYLMTGVDNMWINVGRSQFHLPTAPPQVLRGHVGLLIPDRERLLNRLFRVREALCDSAFQVKEHESFVEVTSPWANTIRCYEAERTTGGINLGISTVEFDVPLGAAPRIARFYREMLETAAETAEDGGGAYCCCRVGETQRLIFRETDRPLADYDNHHIQVYLVNFSRPWQRLTDHGLITEESNRYQYRFRDLIDLETGDVLFSIEHEVRSMTHPLYARPLVNRDPERNARDFVRGAEGLAWSSEARRT